MRYSLFTCHWCHVMERESFENEEIGQLLNEFFVSIKVDREERPDIDNIYMNVCQALTGHGGWPLSIFMSAEKKPFFAATYLPRNSRGGLFGLKELLPKIADLWINEREVLIQSGEETAERIGALSVNVIGEKPGKEIFKRAFGHFRRTFDSLYGGFGIPPKFPSPHILFFLMRYQKFNGEKKALDMVEKTLQAMYRGGIYDHIGFGFARYSTDARWMVPHFEKMLYDNALLAIAYLEAYQITHKDIYARVAREIFTYILRDMTSSQGAFYSAEDADSEGKEGKFYLWTEDEVISVLGSETGRYFCCLYDIGGTADFEGESIPNLSKQMINEEERKKVERARERLFTYREKRVHPYKDDKILSAWNGLMIAALAFGARVLDEAEYLYAARRAAEFIMDNLRRSDGRLLARYRDGEALYPAYAFDYACLIWGLIELYTSSYEVRYLQYALRLNEDLMEYFWDEENGGLFFYGSDSEQLLTRPKESYDGAVPSANSIAAMNFLRLAGLTGNLELEKKAERQIEAFAGSINEIPYAHAHFLNAMIAADCRKEIVIVGKRDDTKTRLMLEASSKNYLPNTIRVFKAEGDEEDISRFVPYAQDMKMLNAEATAYICEKFACQAPVTNLNTFLESLQN